MSSVTEVLVDSSCIRKRLVLEDTRGTEVIDPVHGRFHLGPICSLAEGTAALQRLRNLKQLGPTCYGPYPAAVHTRHEHSLGVAHLARLCLVHLAAAGAEDDVRQADVELTALAGEGM
jgi:HD superfamily phosphohydrolase